MTALAEDEHVIDVDNPDANPLVLEESGGSDDLERDLDTTSYEDDIGVDTSFGGVSRPY